MRRPGLVAAVAVVMLQFIAAPAQASSFTFNPVTNTYSYQGDLFNVCGYGCPEHAPVDPVGVDYIIASLTFAAPLAANLTFADLVPVPTAWTMTDHLGDLSSPASACRTVFLMGEISVYCCQRTAPGTS